MTMTTDQRVDDYRQGYMDALRAYAWWRNGEQMVGCGVWSLKKAIEHAEEPGGAISRYRREVEADLLQAKHRLASRKSADGFGAIPR